MKASADQKTGEPCCTVRMGNRRHRRDSANCAVHFEFRAEVVQGVGGKIGFCPGPENVDLPDVRVAPVLVIFQHYHLQQVRS